MNWGSSCSLSKLLETSDECTIGRMSMKAVEFVCEIFFSNTEVIFWQKGLSSSSQEQCEYLQKGGHGHPQKWQIMVMEALSLCLLALASWRETAHGKLYKKGDSKQWERERVRQVKSNDDHVHPSSARCFNGQSFNLCWCWFCCVLFISQREFQYVWQIWKIEI